MWIVTEATFTAPTQHHAETIFTIGNGYLATRGALEEGHPGDRRATFIHGVFDDAPVVMTELANAPDWLPLVVLLNGERFSLATGTVLDYQRTLDLRTATLTRRVRWRSPAGAVATLTFERFASLAQTHLLAMRCHIAPEFTGEVEVRAALNGHTDNEGLTHWAWQGQGRRPEAVFLHTRTRRTGIGVALAMRLTPSGPVTDRQLWEVDNQPAEVVRFTAQPGVMLGVEKYVGVATTRETADPVAMACQSVAGVTWEAAASANRAAWQAEWARTDVEIEGDVEAQLALRFNLFQLLIAAPRHDEHVNIGAKTLSGFGYRGHAFWDTEIFMLPVFTYTAPHIARNLLNYRYHTLPAARDKARAAGYEGAWFAWESAATGEEVTPTWVPDFHDKKKLARVWTGDLALHIASDVAYAAHQYWRVTGDDDWYRERGAELVLDTAKFMAARAEWNAATGEHEYRDVIGPDEYHDHVNNNAYTNRLARWNLETALEAWAWLNAQAPSAAAALGARLDLTPTRLAHWRQVADTLRVRVQPDGLIEQFDGYFDLQPVNLDDYEPRTRSMHEIFGIEGANAYQAIKQPDVLMLQFLLREAYPDAVIRVNYDYYNTRTDHTYGSSLGPAIQAIIACAMGDLDAAYTHFIRAARADLRDVRGNAGDGIHAASAAGTWQAVVFGFAGLRLTATGWTTAPHLPRHWQRLTFRFFYRGQLQTVRVEQPPPAGRGEAA